MLIEAECSEVDEVKEILRDKMENAVKLSVPLIVDMHTGKIGMRQNRRFVGKQYKDRNRMKVLGITGGVGSGKSEVLDYLESRYGAYVCQMDEVAKRLEKEEKYVSGKSWTGSEKRSSELTGN